MGRLDQFTEEQLKKLVEFIKTIMRKAYPDKDSLIDEMDNKDMLSDYLEVIDYERYSDYVLAENFSNMLTEASGVKIQVSRCDTIEDILDAYGENILKSLK